MKKWKERIQKLNLKKIAIGYVATAIIVMVISGIALVWNFGPRIQVWKDTINQQSSQIQEENSSDNDEKNIQKEEHSRGNNEHDKFSERAEWFNKVDIDNIITLTQTDKIMLGITMAVLAIMFCIYWILVILGTLKMSYRYDVNPVLWGCIALFFNLLAVVALYLYAMFWLKCPYCGKIHKKNMEYCSRCGKAFFETCASCGSKTDVNAVYCSNCGNKIKQEETNSEPEEVIVSELEEEKDSEREEE